MFGIPTGVMLIELLCFSTFLKGIYNMYLKLDLQTPYTLGNTLAVMNYAPNCRCSGMFTRVAKLSLELSYMGYTQK